MAPTYFRPIPVGPRSRRRGIALILVLACVVLLTVMVLAYLASIGTEVRSSKFYANGGSVKLLAQSTGDLVMAEIRDATANGSLCWASQPGMIRTYDNTGAAYSYYKLYSDATMTGTGAFDYTQNAVPPAWNTQTGVYVDLNQPVPIVTGTATTYVYPIVDGALSDYTTLSGSFTPGVPANALVLASAPGSGTGLASGPYAGYPQVTGFGISSAPGVTSSSLNQAPMPVRWLYVLKNGSLAVPNSSTTGTVTFMTKDPINTSNALPVPTATNPIVGRIAFWTDDETCKVNLNTAGESDSVLTVTATTTSVAIGTGPVHSTVWDLPRAGTSSEINLSRYQPAENEFQRYPGHPATVCLSTVFGSLSTDPNFPENIYPITPRLTATALGKATSSFWGGEVYSYVATATGPGSYEGVQAVDQTLTGPLSLSINRLYADADEFLYQKGRTLNSSAELSQSTIKQSEFFVTANSRAPDVNLFNQPRVSMWPVSTSTGSWSAHDNLLAFCATIDGYPYCFQRANPNDEYADLPTATATGTGFGNLGRNRNLLEYLRYLTSQPIPGFGGNFGGTSGKYIKSDVLTHSGVTGNERDQILTEMFDYIRSTNIQDITSTGTIPFTPAIFVPSGNTATSSYNPGKGQVVPIVDQKNTTRGFGRFPTIHSASLVFFPLQNGLIPTLTGTTTYNYHATTQMQAVLVLQMFDPSQAFPMNIPCYQIQISGLSTGFAWGGISGAGSPAMFSSDTATIGNPYGGPFVGNQNEDRQTGGICDFRRLLVSSTGSYTYSAYNPVSSNAYIYNASVTGTATSPNAGNLFSTVYPATPPAAQSGTPIYINTVAGSAQTPAIAAAALLGPTFSFTGGTITCKIYSNTATGAPNQLLQTVTFTIPGDTGVPIPNPSANGYSSGPLWTWDHGPSNTVFNNTLTNPSQAGWELWNNRMASIKDPPTVNASGTINGYSYAINFISDGDVIRSAMPQNGDLRLLAARQNVISGDGDTYFFTKHPAYGTGMHFAQDLQDDLGRNVEWGGTCSGTNIIYGNASYYDNGAFGATTRGGGSGGALVSINTSDTPSLTQAYGGLTSTTCLTPTYYPDYEGYGDTSGNAGTHWSDIPSQRGAFVGDPSGTMTSASTGAVPGDWDNGVANQKDGPYINKADEGNTSHGWFIGGGYFDFTAYTNPGTAFFSPNRMVPSPGMFGSLPTGVLENKPWQTLLFRPGPAGHPGLGYSVSGTITSAAYAPPYTIPPDSLLMDLFTMPVVEPYAISEPLSTAGRINMNYQIVPFTYITRNTAVQAALRSAWVTAIPSADGSAYKANIGGATPASSVSTYRNGLNIPTTLSQFDARMTTNKDLFRSAAEICSIDLVPSGFTAPTHAAGTAGWRTDMDADWNSYALTGDNTRERPYANLYPLLTTKSNTFTVHFRVQTLQPTPGISYNPPQWREGTDVITGEYRGSQTIERYVDPGDPSIPDFTTTSTGTLAGTQTLAPYYKFRVLANKQFAP